MLKKTSYPALFVHATLLIIYCYMWAAREGSDRSLLFKDRNARQQVGAHHSLCKKLSKNTLLYIGDTELKHVSNNI